MPEDWGTKELPTLESIPVGLSLLGMGSSTARWIASWEEAGDA